MHSDLRLSTKKERTILFLDLNSLSLLGFSFICTNVIVYKMATNYDEIRPNLSDETTIPNHDSDSPDSDALLPSDQRDDEYYSVLNVARGADEYELKRAFNRMSLRYHPDRYSDPIKKKTAQDLFMQVRKAYDVLKDPAKRSIYDAHGRKGLESNWTIITRHPKLFEHEVYIRMREEMDEMMSYSSNGLFSVGVNLTDVDKIQGSEGIDLSRIAKYVYTEDILIQETILTEIGATRLTIGGSVSLNEKSRHHGQFSLGLAYTSVSGLFTQVTGSIGNWPMLKLALRKRITDNIHFRFTGIAKFAGPYFMGFAMPAVRAQLGDKTHLDVGFQIGENHSKMITTLSHQFTPRFICSTKLEFEPTNPSVKLQCIYLPTPQYLIKCGIAYGLKSQALKYSIRKSFSDQISVSVSFAFKSPGGMMVKFILSRYGHTFKVPVRFSDNLTVQRSVYGHLLPLAIYGIAYAVYYSPLFKWVRIKKAANEEHVKEEQLEKESKRQAEVALMSEAYERSLATETDKGGLVIKEAWYGILKSRTGIADRLINDGLPCVLDVTVPLQCLVKDSKLLLTDTSKAHLAGFYDVYKGERKDLNVTYFFHGILHEVTVSDDLPLSIPIRAHQLRP